MKFILKHSQYFKIVILCFFILSCNGKRKLLNDMSQLCSKPINLPEQSQITIRGKDTLMDAFMKSEVKLVVYVDSIRCASCGINRMYLWKHFIEYAKSYNGRLKYYFIFAPAKKDINSVIVALASNSLDYPILINHCGEFERLNPHLPKNSAFHTFLLDENNKVILVGNPLHNKEIEKLFYKITQELLAK